MNLSIITINYNNNVGLERTIKSVVGQNLQNIEFIVVDGSSTDGSVEIIKNNEVYISKWISEKDNGIYNALNKGIKMATNDYLLFLNSGDHLFSNTVLSTIDKHISGEDLICFDIHVLGQGFDQINKHPNKISFSFLFHETLAHQSVFIKRSLFDKVGFYDESLKIVSDWKFFIHALAYHNCTYKSVHEILSVYYLDGISSTAEGTFTRRAEREKILKEEFSIFYEDYIELQKLEMNRFKMLSEIEKTSFGMKFLNVVLRIYIVLFSKRELKDILN